jgi:hypothetical protein
VVTRTPHRQQPITQRLHFFAHMPGYDDMSNEVR